MAILGGTAEPDAVARRPGGLQGLGLTWEASRLTGQAAIRSADLSVTRALLEQARDLKAALPTAEATDAAATASVLSEREQMVAQYIVDGLTHKEIGAQLYISPRRWSTTWPRSARRWGRRRGPRCSRHCGPTWRS